VSAQPSAPSASRTTDGIVLLDKPFGLSSNAALQRVKRLLGATRAGHAGTLDPLATGMLPVCLGQATKVCGELLGATKAYRVGLALGTSTTTGDLEGEPLAHADVLQLDVATVAARLQVFVGPHDQVPPMHAAIKQNGTPLYRLARAGVTVERRPRRIELHRLTLRAYRGDFLEFDVECSKGTYIRVLGEDIAAALGTVGHVTVLHRLWVEPFATAAMVTLDELAGWARAGTGDLPSWWLAADSALSGLRRLDLDDASARALRQGKIVELAVAAGPARVYDRTGQFLGLVDVDAAGHARVKRFFVGAPPPVLAPILEKTAS
jgi:tRNA pseudouridine55 synthase